MSSTSLVPVSSKELVTHGNANAVGLLNRFGENTLSVITAGAERNRQDNELIAQFNQIQIQAYSVKPEYYLLHTNFITCPFVTKVTYPVLQEQYEFKKPDLFNALVTRNRSNRTLTNENQAVDFTLVNDFIETKNPASLLSSTCISINTLTWSNIIGHMIDKLTGQHVVNLALLLYEAHFDYWPMFSAAVQGLTVLDFVRRENDFIKISPFDLLYTIYFSETDISPFLSNIQRENLANVTAPEFCFCFGIQLLKESPDKFDSASEACSIGLAGAMLAMDTKHLTYPVHLLEIHSENETLFNIALPFLKNIEVDLLITLIQAGVICRHFTRNSFDAVTWKSINEHMSSQCFQNLAAVDKTNHEDIGEMPDTVLQGYKGALTELTIGNLRAAQFKIYVESTNIEPCKNIGIHFLSDAAFGMVSWNCLRNYLNSKMLRSLENKWRHLNLTVFESLVNYNVDMLGRILPRDFKSMPAKLMQFIWSGSTACKYLPATSKPFIAEDASISHACFAQLDAETLQPYVLTELKVVPDNLLASVSNLMVNKWTYTYSPITANSNSVMPFSQVAKNKDKDVKLKSIAVLHALEHHSNFNSIFQHTSSMLLKSDPSGTGTVAAHACASIVEVSHLEPFTAVDKFMTSECAENIDASFAQTNLHMFPRVWMLHYWEKLCNEGTAPNIHRALPKLSEASIKEMLADEAICTNMDPSLYKSLLNHHKQLITATCFAEIPCKTIFTTEEFSYLSKDVLTLITSASFKNLEWGHIPMDYVAQLSIGLGDKELPNTAWSLLKKNDIKQLSALKVLNNLEKHWKYILAETISGCDKHQIKALSDKIWKQFTAEQIKNIDKAAMDGFEAKMVQYIGGENNTEPLEALVNHAGASRAVKYAANERLALYVKRPIPWMLILVSSLVAMVVVFILVVVLMCYIRRRRSRPAPQAVACQKKTEDLPVPEVAYEPSHCSESIHVEDADEAGPYEECVGEEDEAV